MYKTQMEAARKGIITKEMEAVAAKEYRTAEEIRELVAKGLVAICETGFTQHSIRMVSARSKIAAHAADIAKHIPHAMDIDNAMADVRRTFDWDKQWECSIDPETAKKIRDDRKPEIEEAVQCAENSVL